MPFNSMLSPRTTIRNFSRGPEWPTRKDNRWTSIFMLSLSFATMWRIGTWYSRTIFSSVLHRLKWRFRQSSANTESFQCIFRIILCHLRWPHVVGTQCWQYMDKVSSIFHRTSIQCAASGMSYQLQGSCKALCVARHKTRMSRIVLLIVIVI